MSNQRTSAGRRGGALADRGGGGASGPGPELVAEQRRGLDPLGGDRGPGGGGQLGARP